MFTSYLLLRDGSMIERHDTSDGLVAWVRWQHLLTSGSQHDEPVAVLERDGVELDSVGLSGKARRWPDPVPGMPQPALNDCYRELLRVANVSDRDVREALQGLGLPVSGSRVAGWFGASARKAVPMTPADLLLVIRALVQSGYLALPQQQSDK